MKKTIIILIAIVVIISGGLFLYNRFTLAKRVVANQNKWNMFLSQDSNISGEYMGFLYDNNFDINTMPKNYVLSLLVSYYIQNDDDFFNEKNKTADYAYQKDVTYDELLNSLREMFGPDYKEFDFSDFSYGCGRSLVKKSSDLYTIRANDPEGCGIFDDTEEKYIHHIMDFSKDKDRIIINIKAAYMSMGSTGRISLYTNKDKAQVVDYDYSYSCLGSEDENCYNVFNSYQVVLKKASDNKYYFYSISRE